MPSSIVCAKPVFPSIPATYILVYYHDVYFYVWSSAHASFFPSCQWGMLRKKDSVMGFMWQVVKVADFGVARVKAQSGVMTAETGTYRWMAPEVSLWLCELFDLYYAHIYLSSCVLTIRYHFFRLTFKKWLISMLYLSSFFLVFFPTWHLKWLRVLEKQLWCEQSDCLERISSCLWYCPLL